MTLNCLEKLRKLQINKDYKMTLINGVLDYLYWSIGPKNGRCYSIFGNVKCLHTGPGNTGMNCEMGRTILSKTVKEKYLAVTMNANMKVSEQG